MADEDLGDALNNLDSINSAKIISLKNDGNTYYKQGFFKEALDCYNQALQIDSNNLDVLNNKGLALVKLDRIDEAKKCHETIKEIKNNHQTHFETIAEAQPPPISTPKSASKFCYHCGSELKFKEAEICPNCGMRLKEPNKTNSPEGKNPEPAKIHSLVNIVLYIIAGLFLIGIILFVGAIVAAFIFGMAGNVSKTESVAVTASNNNGLITITNNGGPDIGDVSSFSVSVDGAPITKQLGVQVGSMITIQGKSGTKTHVIVTGTFKTGTQQVLLDTNV